MNLPAILTAPVAIAIVIGAYAIGTRIYGHTRRTPFLQPVLIATVITAVCVSALGYSRESFRSSVQLIDLMLGPAIVALALPLYDNFRAVRRIALGLFAATLISGSLIIVTTLVLHRLVGVEPVAAASVSLRSITAPVAVAIAEAASLAPELTMLSAFVSGLVAVMLAPRMMRALGVHDDAVRGFTLGITAHAFGIARSVEISPRAAAFATVGMGLTATLAALLVPLFL